MRQRLLCTTLLQEQTAFSSVALLMSCEHKNIPTSFYTSAKCGSKTTWRLRLALCAFSHHALPVCRTSLRHWGNSRVTANFPYISSRNKEAWRNDPPCPLGPTLRVALLPVVKLVATEPNAALCTGKTCAGHQAITGVTRSNSWTACFSFMIGLRTRVVKSEVSTAAR